MKTGIPTVDRSEDVVWNWMVGTLETGWSVCDY